MSRRNPFTAGIKGIIAMAQAMVGMAEGSDERSEQQKKLREAQKKYYQSLPSGSIPPKVYGMRIKKRRGKFKRR